MHCEAAFASGVIFMGIVYQIRALILRQRIWKLMKEFDKAAEWHERVGGQWETQRKA